MTPINAFNKYVAIKKHFTDVKYDLTKIENGKINVARTAFDKHKTKRFFERITEDFKDTEIIEYLVANMVDGTGKIFDPYGRRIYKEYKIRLKNLDYLFASELEDIKFQGERLKKDPFDCSQGYSIVMQMYLGRKIGPETLIILDRFVKFKEEHDKKFVKDYLWEDISLLMVKYRPFIRIAHKLDYYEEVYKNVLGNQDSC